MARITRRELLSTAAAMPGLSRLTPALFSQQTTRSSPPPPANQSRWSAAAVTKLRTQQELQYAILGRRMGIGADPMKAYQALTRGRMPPEWISPDKFRRTFPSAPKDATGRGAPDAVINDYLAKYGKVEPPTPYEDPTWYAVLLEMLDSIEAAWTSRGFRRPPQLLIGTLPTGTTNAVTFTLEPSKERIIIFERGLFDFAFHMSKIAAIVFPPIDLVRGRFASAPNVGRAVSAHPEILDLFNRVLHAYLVEGDPRRVRPFAIDNSRLATAALLLRSLELFVLGHEYGHAATAHDDNLGPNPSQDPAVRYDWDDEYGADRVGMSLMDNVIGDFTMSFWGAINLFACLEIFDRCRSILATGRFDPKATSRTHPPHLVRAQQLRTVVREVHSRADAESAIGLADELDSFWSRLWQVAEPEWLDQYQKGVRPSLIW